MVRAPMLLDLSGEMNNTGLSVLSIEENTE